jgi:hypothetical protein
MQDPSIPRDLTLNHGTCARDERGVALVFGYVEYSVQTSDAVGVNGQLRASFRSFERRSPSRLQLRACFKGSLITSRLPGSEVFALSLTADVLLLLLSQEAGSNLLLCFSMSDHCVSVFVAPFLGTERMLVGVLRVVGPVLTRRRGPVIAGVLAGRERSRLCAGWRSESDGYRNGHERDDYCSNLHLFYLRLSTRCANPHAAGLTQRPWLGFPTYEMAEAPTLHASQEAQQTPACPSP